MLTMTTNVEECQELVAYILPMAYGRGDYTVHIDQNPSRILEFCDFSVALYAQNLSSGTVAVNLMMPRTRAFLMNLASYGVGAAQDYNGVRYRFCWCKCCFPLFSRACTWKC